MINPGGGTGQYQVLMVQKYHRITSKMLKNHLVIHLLVLTAAIQTLRKMSNKNYVIVWQTQKNKTKKKQSL